MSTTAPGNAEPQLGAKTPAPKVRPIPAQGSALGSRHAPTQALKGRPKTACRVIAPARECLFSSSLNLHPYDFSRLQTDRGRRDPGGLGGEDDRSSQLRDEWKKTPARLIASNTTDTTPIR